MDFPKYPKWSVVFLTENGQDYCSEKLKADSKDKAIKEASNLWIAFHHNPNVWGFRLECW